MGRAVLKEVETGATVVALPGAKPGVVPLPAPARKPLSSRLLPWLRAILVNVLPPLVTVALIALFWQIAASGPQSSLPPPTKIWEEAKDLIVEPFYWAGSQDIGLGWRILVSLQRVAIGFSLAAIVGVLLGALVGQSVWAMRGLDPIFQVLRTVPPLAWLPLSLAAFRDSQPSAIFVIFITAIWPVIINTAVGIRNIPQDYRNVAQVLRLNQVEFFFKIMVPSAAPYQAVEEVRRVRRRSLTRRRCGCRSARRGGRRCRLRPIRNRRRDHSRRVPPTRTPRRRNRLVHRSGRRGSP